MGTGSKTAAKAGQSAGGAIQPAAAAASASVAPLSGPVSGGGSPGGGSMGAPAAPLQGSPAVPAGAAAASELAQAAALLARVEQLRQGLPSDPPLAGAVLEAWHGGLAGAYAELRHSALPAALAAGADPAAVAALAAQADEAAGQAVAELSEAQLLHLAAANGFQHPEFVIGPAGQLSPLAAWLNPVVPAGSPAKDAIQAKALERYNRLGDGQDSAAEGGAEAQSQPAPAPSAPLPVRYGFTVRHARLVAALAHAGATAADLPPRMSPAEVAAASFGPGLDVSLGGVHAKTVHDGPGERKWLFKPDASARAAAEAAASAALHAGGIPSVPVYERTVGGKKGTIQPMVTGAGNLPGTPAKWSQADVDAIVRHHVAAWAVGDHDAHPANILRTPSGGLVPIDYGAAFKHYGSDKLSTGYAPHGGQPVFNLAYAAHKSGGLAPGVTVNPAAAHPVIKAYESIPDAQWRAMLHDTAHRGAAEGVAWVPAMRKRAAAEHGTTPSKVTATQIAESFLDYACERKKRLRADFAQFFSADVGLPGGQALLHGGR